MLASVILASLNNARSKARDARRSADIRSVQTALEMYYSDHISYITSFDVQLDTALASLAPNYIASLPKDPGSGVYRYYNNGTPNAQYYAIYVPFENKAACYMCGGSTCAANLGWWGINICQ